MRKSLNRIAAAATTLAMVAATFFPIAPASAATFLAPIKDVMSRLKVSVPSVSHTFTITVSSGSATGRMILLFSDGFSALSAAGMSGVCSGGGVINTFTSNTGAGTNTLVAENVNGCSGTITLTGATATNPSSAGSNTIHTYICTDGTACNDFTTAEANAQFHGDMAVAIVNDDQVSVTANVDPSITFVVGATTSGCSNTFATNGGTVALGTLSPTAITSSGVSSVKHICSLVSTNADLGYAITVKSANGSLKSVLNATDTIPSATAVVNIGTANYGICAGSASSDFGYDTTTPAGSSATSTSPFNTDCRAAADTETVGALTTSAQTILSNSGPVQNSYATYRIKASISATIPAHNDYADTLTFIATGTF